MSCSPLISISSFLQPQALARSKEESGSRSSGLEEPHDSELLLSSTSTLHPRTSPIWTTGLLSFFEAHLWLVRGRAPWSVDRFESASYLGQCANISELKPGRMFEVPMILSFSRAGSAFPSFPHSQQPARKSCSSAPAAAAIPRLSTRGRWGRPRVRPRHASALHHDLPHHPSLPMEITALTFPSVLYKWWDLSSRCLH